MSWRPFLRLVYFCQTLAINVSQATTFGNFLLRLLPVTASLITYRLLQADNSLSPKQYLLAAHHYGKESHLNIKLLHQYECVSSCYKKERIVPNLYGKKNIANFIINMKTRAPYVLTALFIKIEKYYLVIIIFMNDV